MAITAYGGLLRLDAISARYGPFDGPPWLAALERHAVPPVRRLRPILPWGRIATPYVGGDPINYLASGREMRHFYAANVREPMFPALTHLFLRMLGDRDVAVSFASAAASTLTIYATWLLGASAVSPAAGLLAALAIGIETVAIGWSADGWRDDTFMLFVTLAAWRLVRLRQRPTAANGVWCGVATAGACLTRITAASFALPALLWVACAGSGDRRPRVRSTVVAAAVALALTSPYLIACAIEFGDPLYAVNYHTRYYRAAQGRAPDPSIGALEYVSDELTRHPTAGLDTVARGLFVWPFAVKWTGFAPWSATLAWALPWCALAGLLLLCWTADGRLLLLVLATSLVPYCVTWRIGGGGEWRFTAHVYPIFLVAAAAAVTTGAGWLRQLARRDVHVHRAGLRRLAASLAIVAVAVLAYAGLQTLPYFIAREALAGGEAVTIAAGDRDGMFFRGAWSEPHGGGNVTVRAALDGLVQVRVPLPLRTDYDLTLRLDPPELERIELPPSVRVFLDGRLLARITLSLTSGRMGAYHTVIPRELTGRTFNSIALVASQMTPAGAGGQPFAWLPPSTPVAFRLWYVRLEPRTR